MARHEVDVARTTKHTVEEGAQSNDGSNVDREWF